MDVEIESTGSEEEGDKKKEEEESNNEFLYDNDECLKIAEFKKYLDDMEPKTRVKRKVGEIGQKGEETVVEGEHETTLGGGKTNYEKVVGSIDFNEIAGKRIFNAYQGPILDDIDNDNTNEKIRGEIDSFLKFYNRETKLDDIYKTIRILIIKDIVFNNIYKNEMIYDEDPEKNSDPIEFVNTNLRATYNVSNWNAAPARKKEFDADKLKPEDDIVLGTTSNKIDEMMLKIFTDLKKNIFNEKYKYLDTVMDDIVWDDKKNLIRKLEIGATDYEDKHVFKTADNIKHFFIDLVNLNKKYEQTNFVGVKKVDEIKNQNLLDDHPSSKQIKELVDKWKLYDEAYDTIQNLPIDKNIENIKKLLDAGLTMRNDYSVFFRNPIKPGNRGSNIWDDIFLILMDAKYNVKDYFKGGGRKTRKSKNKSTRNGRRRSRARKYNCTKRRHKNTKTRKRNVKNNNLEI